MQVSVTTPTDTAVGAALVAAAAAAPSSPVAVKTAAVVAVKSATPPKKAAPAPKPAASAKPAPPAKTAASVGTKSTTEVVASTTEELNPGVAIQNALANPPVAETPPVVVGTSDADTNDGGIELPSNIDLEEVDTNPQGVGVLVKIFGTGCLECSCLVADPELAAIPSSKLPSCHFSKGQDLCPARAVRIQPVGERVLFVRKWKRAQEAGDSNRILRFTTELTAMDASLRNEIMKEIGLIA